MASHPIQQCCTKGVAHEGTPKGSMIKIGDTEAYIAKSSSGSTENAILLCTDAIGHGFVNPQLIADQFAANGYHVVMPDLFHGDSVPLNKPADFDLMAWLKGPPGHPPHRVDPVVKEVLENMRGEMGVKRLGAVGYCFGARYVIRELAEGGGVDVGYVAHPSFVEAQELEKIRRPLSISAAETDYIFVDEKRHESERILKKIKQTYQINLFSGVEHGFAVRADIAQKPAKFAKEQAFYQAVQWFDTYLKQ